MMKMEIDSGVNEGNYCMVYGATILTSAFNIKVSTFKLNYLYNPGNLLFIHLL